MLLFCSHLSHPPPASQKNRYRAAAVCLCGGPERRGRHLCSAVSDVDASACESYPHDSGQILYSTIGDPALLLSFARTPGGAFNAHLDRPVHRFLCALAVHNTEHGSALLLPRRDASRKESARFACAGRNGRVPCCCSMGLLQSLVFYRRGGLRQCARSVSCSHPKRKRNHFGRHRSSLSRCTSTF